MPVNTDPSCWMCHGSEKIPCPVCKGSCGSFSMNARTGRKKFEPCPNCNKKGYVPCTNPVHAASAVELGEAPAAT